VTPFEFVENFFQILVAESFTDLTLKVSWSYLASLWQGSRVWRTDRQTHRQASA